MLHYKINVAKVRKKTGYVSVLAQESHGFFLQKVEKNKHCFILQKQNHFQE